MRTFLSMLLLASAMTVAVAASDDPMAGIDNATVSSITDLVTSGQFQTAQARIDVELKRTDLPPDARRALEFQHVRMQRIRNDFTLTADDVKQRVRQQMSDLTDAEFARWDERGLFEHMVIDGERRYFARSPSNLFRLSAEAEARRKDRTPFAHGDVEQLSDYHRAVIEQSKRTGRSSVMPHKVKVTQSLTVKPDAVPAGKTLRVWIPFPRAIAGQQQDIRFVSSQPSKHTIAPESALQRTVYLEQPAHAKKPTVFSVTYELTVYSQYHAIDAANVAPEAITSDLTSYVSERAPHIAFTQPLRIFSKQVVGNATNPYQIAQRIFAAVDEIPWAGAREYSTIPDLSAYTLDAGHGDCGEQTLLLITLMRMNGIPARWQSGWTFTNGEYNDIHDWAEIYLAPYGWIPVDVTYGRLDSADPALKWFYLGGLDNFRIAFNDDFSAEFVPRKQFFRSDTVDSQRGEVEWDGGDLYYDQWSYDFAWKVTKAK
jgi:transglutaminase-like putative cysteine protease